MKKHSLMFLILVCVVTFAQTQQANAQTNTQEPELKVEPFMQFWSKVRESIYLQKINLNKDYRIHIKSNFPNGKISEGRIISEIAPSQPELVELQKEFLLAVDESRVLQVIAPAASSEKIDAAEIAIDFAQMDVNLKLSLKTNSEMIAKKMVNRLKGLFSITALTLKNNPVGEFYKNAIINSEKDRITVTGKISRANLEKYLTVY